MSLSSMAPTPARTNPKYRSTAAVPPTPPRALELVDDRALVAGAPLGSPGCTERATAFDDGWALAQKADSFGLRQTLVVALQPEVRAALQAPPSEWFASAERLAATEDLSVCAVATLFDEELLAAMGLARSDPWFAFAWRRLSGATAQGHRQAPATAPNRTTTAAPDSAAAMVVATADESQATLAHPAPTQKPTEAVSASPEPPDETTAPPERIIRLLPEVTRSMTAGATSVEALATAVFNHLTGRAA